MPKAAPLQSNFNGGEFSPLVYGRVDSDLYRTGLATCLNYLPTEQGGVVRRPGTSFVKEVKTSAKSTRLVEFEFSTEQAYVLEFGDLYIRVFKDHANVELTGSPYEIVTPYLEADLFELKFTQSADVLYIVHPDYAPRKLSRTGDTSWTLETIAFQDGPYLNLNPGYTTLTANNTFNPDVSTGRYSGQGFSVSTQIKSAQSMDFNPDGDIAYVFDASTSIIYQYSLGTPFDITTAVYANKKYDASTQVAGGQQIRIDPSGFTVMISDIPTTSVYQYTLSTAFDISTASYATKSLNTSAQTSLPRGMDFSKTGDKLFISDGTGTVYEYWLTGANFDLGTVSYSQSASVAAAGSGTNGLVFDDSGLQLYVTAFGTRIHTFLVASAFDLTSITDTGEYLDMSAITSVSYYVTRNNSGSRFYTLDTVTDSIRQWDIETGRDSTVLTASAVTDINSGQGFLSTDVGRSIRMAEGVDWGWAVITALNSTTSVDIRIESPLTSTNPTVFWRLGAWSGTTGYPAAVTFHEDRLTFGGCPEVPQRIDGSQSSDYENFAPTEIDGSVLTSSAISFTLNADKVNNIRWLLSEEKGLMVGTVGAEWIVRPSVLGEAMSAINISAKRPSARGSADIQALVAGKTPIFVQRAGRKIRELRYHYSGEGFETPDRTILAEHITQTGILEMAYQAEPYSLIWMVRTDGVLACMTYQGEGENAQVAWHRHILGGVGDASGNPPIVESVAAIPAPDGTADEVWIVVKRYIDGATVRYIEYFKPVFDDETDLEDAFCLDSGLTYSGAATTTITGLDHLEGETLSVLADGAIQVAVTVASGQVTLAAEASKVTLGYPYNSDGQLLRLEAGSANGTALGKTRRTHRVGMLLHRTLGLSIGPNFSDMDRVVFRTTTDEMGAPVPLFSGIISETVEFDYDFENQFCWRQNTPLPGTILAIMPQMVTQDR